MQFTYHMPTKILFGPGTLNKLGKTPLPGSRALIVIGKSGAMRRQGYLGRLEKLLEAAGATAVVYDRIIPNPVEEHVDEAAEICRREGVDFVVGLGGGSSIDSAKSIAVMATNSGRYWDYMPSGSGGRKRPDKTALPIVAITTTAGTGTEADPWTVITRTDTREKIGWGIDDTFPRLSIVDPELMLSVPPKQTAYTGMDAFFHAAEAYVATVCQPASDHFALEAVRLIARNLPSAVANGADLTARTALAWANTAAGICESLSSCISHHSLEHAVSAFYPEVPHGAGLSMLGPAYFASIVDAAPDRFTDLARAMGADVDALRLDARPRAFVSALEDLIHAVGIGDERLSDYGVSRADIPHLAANAFDAMGALFKVTPRMQTTTDVEVIFARALA